MNQEPEIYIRGTPISKGIAIGTAIFLNTEDQDLPDFPITLGEVDDEIARYHKARSSSRDALKKLQENLESEGSNTVATIIGTHIEMLDDPLMTTHMEIKIREMLKNPEVVFNTVIHDYEKKFSETPDEFFKQRLSDVRDLSQRVLGNLCDSPKASLDQIPQDAIVFVEELRPSDVASIKSSQIGAFVIETGGGTSHAVLIARAKAIPCVLVSRAVFEEAKNCSIIIDGQTGDIILNPAPKTVKKYMQQKNLLMRQYQRLEKEKDLRAETLDGFHVELYANVNDVEDLEQAQRHGTIGIGLFRSEYLFLENQSLFFDEEKQIEIYKNIFSLAKDIPVTFRVMDLGGDKCADLFQEISTGTNSAFGKRGIRFLLHRPDIFATQLRAILQAGVGHQVRILFPLIAEVQELREVQRVVQEVKIELYARGVSFLENPLLGCMLEVPSAVLICDSLCQESDFLALGTNDLIQYTLGVDRNNPNTNNAYLHPAVIRMIRLAALEAKRHFKSVTVCGDMASNPLCTALLVGLGVSISCDPRFIPIVKQTIRRLSLLNAIDIAEYVLTLETSTEIAEYLSEEMRKLEIESEEFSLEI